MRNKLEGKNEINRKNLPIMSLKLNRMKVFSILTNNLVSPKIIWLTRKKNIWMKLKKKDEIDRKNLSTRFLNWLEFKIKSYKNYSNVN